MLRRVAVLGLLGAGVLFGAIWPEQWWEYQRVRLGPVTLQDRAVWDEYGLEAAEEVEYRTPEGSFRATAYRLRDSTCALAVFQWLGFAARQSGSFRRQIGNYVLDFQSFEPPQERLDLLQIQLPHLDESPLPVLPGYLPAESRLDGSLRYIIGPVSLARFEPRISPSLAAFSLGAEAQLARYQTPRGELGILVFSYPTPQIARDRVAEFQKLPGAIAKRTGPLVAVVLPPADSDEAERLLARVNYQATITWNERAAQPELGVAEFLITAFTFIGILLGFTILAGLGYAGIRILWRRWTGRPDDEPMVTLHLSE